MPDSDKACVVFSGSSIAGLFTHVEQVVLAASGYFYATGLAYGFMAAFVIMFSAYQGWGLAVPPQLVSLMRVAIVLIGGCCCSMRLASIGYIILLRVPPLLEHQCWVPFSCSGRQIAYFDAFRLKTGPALITEDLHLHAAFSGV